MKNFKKLVSVIVAILVIVSTIVLSVSTVAAAKNTAFDGKKVYVLSKFNDQENTGGLGIIDEFGKPMTNVPDDAELKKGLPTHALEEYCGTEYCKFFDDSNATGGTAAMIYVGDNYTGANAYKKTKITIRKLGSENIVIPFDGLERSKLTLAFYIKLNNLAKIDAREACIELAEVQDEIEYQLSLETLANYLQTKNSKLEDGKWIRIEIPFTQIPTTKEVDAAKSDVKVNLVRIYLNQKNKAGEKFSEDKRPALMIDELSIVQYDKSFENPSSKPSISLPPVSSVNAKPIDPSAPTSSKDLTSLPPAASGGLQMKPSSSETSAVEDVVSDVTSTTSSDVNTEEDGFPWLWVIIGAAAVVLLGGGALVLVLVLKKKPAAVADAPAVEDTPAEPEAPTDAE